MIFTLRYIFSETTAENLITSKAYRTTPSISSVEAHYKTDIAFATKKEM
jgi:hypothetical protein